MNLTVLLATSSMSLLMATIRSLLFRYFPYVPTVFDSTSTPAYYYDFIVVGAGCGGSVVASRLSETSASVLLLEAGGSAPPESVIPSMSFIRAFRNPDWRYEIKSQKNAFLGFVNNTPMVTLGKVMGGTSVINGMIYTRGNKMDYDSWARLGNTGWDYASVLPYFKKSESFHADDFNAEVSGKYHGRNGPLGITKTKVETDILKQFLEAGRQLGYKTIDPNAKNAGGFFPLHKTIHHGLRSTASESFLAPVVGRPNLQIRTNALVTKVLFNKKKRAVGVQYIIDGKRLAVHARKEVILSAGAVRTPQLLLLSGVGPQEHLEEMGIPVVANIPGVGRNTHAHPGIILPFIIKRGATPSITKSFTVEALNEYITNSTGPLSQSVGQGYAVLNVGGEIPSTWPDIVLGLMPGTFASAGAELTTDQYNYRPEIFEDMYGNLGGDTTFGLMPLLARPKSRGSITLRSRNPHDNPIIDVNIFDHPDDIKLLVKGIRKCFEIARTPAFRDVLDVRVPKNQVTQCKSQGRDTDAYWECHLRHKAFAGYHLTSSAMMAPPRNTMGVVSPRLRIRGVTGLRVVDSSVLPHNIAGNPMATVYMIGEKGADLIKEDWGYFTEFIE